MADSYELPRLMARLKLQVRRQLNQSVDLARLSHDPDYMRQRLAELEDQAADEELLVLILRLRELLSPPEPAALPAAQATQASGPDSAASRPAFRDYRFGARAW